MKSLIEENSSIWVHALLSVAWADGHLDEAEEALISDLLDLESPVEIRDSFVPVSLESLQKRFLSVPDEAENFLKTAVMVALADGLYSTPEDQLLRQFCQVLNLDPPVLEDLRSTLDGQQHSSSGASRSLQSPLESVRHWLDSVDVRDPKVAHFLCKLIPADCPFERDVVLFGKKMVHIPPMCKINPLYEQLVGLRFRSLSFLADECQEDVSPYL